MNDLKKNYIELIELTKLYLLSEHSIKDRIHVDVDSHAYFKSYYKSKKHPKIDNTPLKQVIAKEMNATSPPKPTIQLAPQTIIEKKDPIFAAPKSENLPIPEKKEVITQNPSTFALDPFSTNLAVDNKHFKEFFKEHFPTFTINEKHPQDQKALKLKDAWKKNHQIPPIVILSFNDELHLPFLKNLAKAISHCLAPACVLSAPKIEKEKKWDDLLTSQSLKLIISSDYNLYLLPDGMKYYQNDPKTTQHQLYKTPLLLMSDLSLYLREPQLKPLLWRAICLEFASAQKNDTSK